MPIQNRISASGPWDPIVDELREWDPRFTEACVQMSTNPWTSGVLSRKFVELVSVGLNAACTNLNPEGTRRHIRAALAAGASREEILFVLKCAAVMSIHSCSLGAPILDGWGTPGRFTRLWSERGVDAMDPQLRLIQIEPNLSRTAARA